MSEKYFENSRQLSAYLLICIAGNIFGLGHLNRCLLLANQIRQRGGKAETLVYCDDEAFNADLNLGLAEGVTCLLEKEFTAGLNPTIEHLNENIYLGCILDISHREFMKKNEPLIRNFRVGRGRARILAVIDSLGEDSLGKMFPAFPADFMVLPYVLGSAPIFGGWQNMVGPKYSIIDESFSMEGAREIQHEGPFEILVSCGGSDPKEISIRILMAITLLVDEVSVNVVVGPMFSERLKDKIRKQIRSARYQARILENERCLAEYMSRCDLAVATSGLTKYELAAGGTPALLISIDEIHELANRPFGATGVCTNLRYDATVAEIAREIQRLLSRPFERASMCRAGRELVDGRGGERILAEIEKVENARERV